MIINKSTIFRNFNDFFWLSVFNSLITIGNKYNAVQNKIITLGIINESLFQNGVSTSEVPTAE